MLHRLAIAAAVAASCCLGGAARADTTLELTEVITSPDRTEVLKRLVAGFEAANPGVHVRITSLPWGQAFEKLATMVQGGQVPDVVEMPERWLALYANNKQLEDLSPYVAEWDGAKDLSPRVMQYASVVDGKPYMMPYGFYIRALFWNRKLFKEAGIDRPPATMADFEADARKVSALGNGKYGYCLRGGTGGANIYLMLMTTMAGSDKFFDESGQWTLNRPEAVKGLQALVDMYQSGAAPKDSINWGFNEIVAGFYSGTCAMLDQDPDALIGIKDRMGADDFAVAPMPLGPSGKAFPTLGYTGWAMFASSGHKDESWKLIRHLESPESNLAWSKFVGVVPIHQSAQADAYFQTEQFRGWLTELNDPRWQLTPVPAYLEEYGFWSDSLSIQSGQEALLGQRTAQDVADEWATYFTDAHKKWADKQRGR